jgi:virginiamycin B lyase
MPKTFSATLIAAAAATVFFSVAAEAQAQTRKAPPPLPEGKGKQLVEGMCAGCHGLQLINNSSGYSREHWRELVGWMVDLSGSTAQQDEVLDYLATNFPAGYNKRPAKPVPGNFQVTFREYVTPQLGARTRDPSVAADGAIWYAGQFGNIIGRFDPKTGQAKEYTLPEKSMPHTVQLDPKGRPWFSGNKNATLGWIDPATGKATVYKMTDPEAKDPHTLAFDKRGIVYFTFQASNRVGRLDPDTGDLKVVKVAAERSQPYDIKFDREGTLWVSCNARPCLLKVHPDTLAVTEVKLPLPITTVRRFDFGPDGTIWYVNSNGGRLGRLNPKTGEIKEWDSPSGPRSHPYAISVLDGAVWYNESGVRPDMLVRFDPATETFQSWPIKSGNVYAGIVRNSRTTPQGTLLIHQTATNRIIEVIPQKR